MLDHKWLQCNLWTVIESAAFVFTAGWSCACSALQNVKEKEGLCLDEGVSGRSDGGMLLRREDEVRGKRIHPLGDIMRGSSCLPLGQTTHRCEGASGPGRAQGERWSPCGMTSLSEPELPLNAGTTRLHAVPGPPRMKKEINHAPNAPEKTPGVPRTFWVCSALVLLG